MYFIIMLLNIKEREHYVVSSIQRGGAGFLDAGQCVGAALAEGGATDWRGTESAPGGDMAFEIYQTNAREVIEQRFKKRGQGSMHSPKPPVLSNLYPRYFLTIRCLRSSLLIALFELEITQLYSFPLLIIIKVLTGFLKSLPMVK